MISNADHSDPDPNSNEGGGPAHNRDRWNGDRETCRSERQLEPGGTRTQLHVSHVDTLTRLDVSGCE